MKKVLFLLTFFISVNLVAQETVASVQDTDELTLNIKKLNQNYTENDFSLWNELLADNAEVFINSSKMDKQAFISAYKGHHSIFNNIQTPDITAETKYYKNGEIWTNVWVDWMGTGNKTGIRYSTGGNFNYMWKDGKIVLLVCFADTAALNMELAAQ